VGGATNLPFLEGATEMPRIALEICDDPDNWSPIVLSYIGDVTRDAGEWAKKAETVYGADLVRLHLTSTRKRDFSNVQGLRGTIENVLQGTGLPLIIEGSNEPTRDSEVFSACGEAAAGERVLLGTAEADRYRSVAAAALAFGHAVIAQSPIDINLAKQLNILLHEIGVPHDRIVIDPFTGTLGYGLEYSYSVMERIRTAALKGDTDLAMPMISAAADSLNIKEVREAPEEVRDETAVMWEFCAAFSAAIAGAEIVCVRHPRTLEKLKTAFLQLAGGL
jgi:acetyl-CoA decarbonylase/synthase complex subunit delta